MSRRSNKQTTAARYSVLTRARQLKNLQARKDDALAADIAKLLEPFIKDEIARQLADAQSEKE